MIVMKKMILKSEPKPDKRKKIWWWWWQIWFKYTMNNEVLKWQYRIETQKSVCVFAHARMCLHAFMCACIRVGVHACPSMSWKPQGATWHTGEDGRLWSPIWIWISQVDTWTVPSGVNSDMLVNFYNAVICSSIMFGSVCWGGNISKLDRGKLENIVKKAGQVVGKPLDSFKTLHEKRLYRKLMQILNNPTHPLRHYFDSRCSNRSGRFFFQEQIQTVIKPHFYPQLCQFLMKIRPVINWVWACIKISVEDDSFLTEGRWCVNLMIFIRVFTFWFDTEKALFQVILGLLLPSISVCILRERGRMSSECVCACGSWLGIIEICSLLCDWTTAFISHWD